MSIPPLLQTEYNLSEAFFQQLTGDILKRILLLGVPSAGVGLYIVGIHMDFVGLATFVLVGGILVVTTWLNVRAQRRSFRTFRLTVGEGMLSRTQDGYRMLTFRRDDIAEIVENEQGVTVIGTNRQMRLGIPKTLERFDDLKAQLASMHPIVAKPEKRAAGFWTIIGSFTGLIGMAIVYLSTNPLLVLGASLLLTGFLLWLFVAIQRSPLYDRRVKRASWMMLFVLFTLGSAIYSAVQKLTN